MPRREKTDVARSAGVGWGGPALTRRKFLTATAAVGAGLTMADVLAACAGPTGATKGGSNTVGQLAGLLPDYVPLNIAKPDMPSVVVPSGASSPPAFLNGPSKLTRAI